ncbi:tyrosine-type recombinase/integrase [Zoogloea sp.]|uniref:tyrosine-type recombinase/integrase n=1 Tax=Zoogloea sp. TaxID=49181 RepID=UPI0035B1AE2F
MLLLLLYNTGARVSEIAGVKVGEVVLEESAACVHLHGKGSKQRSVLLWRSTVRVIRAWIRRNPQFDPNSPLLPNRDGQAMSRWNVIQRLDHARRPSGCGILPRLGDTPYLAARDSPHDGNAPAAGLRRHQRHCALARP